MIEKGWLGGGVPAATPPSSSNLYHRTREHSDLTRQPEHFENLSRDPNYNIMFSPRLRCLAQTEHGCAATNAPSSPTSCRAWRPDGSPQAHRDMLPIINIEGPRYPVLGGLYQERGGTARHDTVAWANKACSADGHGHHPELRGERHRKPRMAVSSRSIPAGPDQNATSWRWSSPVQPLCWPEMAGSGCPSDRLAFRRWCPNRSSLLRSGHHGQHRPRLSVAIRQGEMVIGGGTDGFNNYTSAAAGSMSRKPFKCP